MLTQFGFLGHDAAHRQMFVSAAWNDWTARILSGAGAGLSYGWWRGKHNLHHSAPNQEGRDPDIGPGAVAFTPEIVAERTGFSGWCARHQGWLFFPLLTLEGLSLHIAGIRTLLGSPIRHRVVELLLIGLRLVGFVAFLLVLLPPGKAAAFLAVQLAVFGLLLGGSFAPNHTGMPIVPEDLKIDFLQRQVLMSRNVKGNFLVNAAMGGLNYQIEHHLFPSMPRPHLKLVSPMVGTTAASTTSPTPSWDCSRRTASSSTTSTTSACGPAVRSTVHLRCSSATDPHRPRSSSSPRRTAARRLVTPSFA